MEAESIRENHNMNGSSTELPLPAPGRLIDVHCHIVPGIDDGSRSMADTLELIERAYAQGFGAFIATPHYSRRHANPDIETLVAEVRTEVQKRHPDIMIYHGHETFYHEELPERIDQGEARRLAGSDYVLVEFDVGDSYGNISRGLRRIAEHGYTPVLAHFERYGALREGHRVEEIHQLGVVMQMNYTSIGVGGFFDKELKWCRKQVESGHVDILGTDMHQPGYRPPDTMGAQQWLKKKIGDEGFDILTRRNALHIIKNEPVEHLR